MRNILLISAIAALVTSGAMAQEEGSESDFDYGFVIPSIQVIKICAVEEATENPVPFASISVEYADTVITQSTDELGLLDLTPRSYPFMLTANCEGMMEASYGIFEQPEGPLTILMTREPAEEPELNTNAISVCAFRIEN